MISVYDSTVLLTKNKISMLHQRSNCLLHHIFRHLIVLAQCRFNFNLFILLAVSVIIFIDLQWSIALIQQLSLMYWPTASNNPISVILCLIKFITQCMSKMDREAFGEMSQSRRSEKLLPCAESWCNAVNIYSETCKLAICFHISDHSWSQFHSFTCMLYLIIHCLFTVEVAVASLEGDWRLKFSPLWINEYNL